MCYGKESSSWIIFLKCSRRLVISTWTSDLSHLFSWHCAGSSISQKFHTMLCWLGSWPSLHHITTDWQPFLCLISQSYTLGAFPQFKEVFMVSCAWKFCIHWSIGCNTSLDIHFYSWRKLSVHLHHSGILPQQLSFPCSTYPKAPHSWREISLSFSFYPLTFHQHIYHLIETKYVGNSSRNCE